MCIVLSDSLIQIIFFYDWLSWNSLVILNFSFTSRLKNGYKSISFKIGREILFEIDSSNNETDIGATLSTMYLKAQEEVSFKWDFSDLEENITFFTSLKSMGRKPKVYYKLSVFSIRFEDEVRTLFARV